MNRDVSETTKSTTIRCVHKSANTDPAPPFSQFSHLRASDSIGAIIVVGCSATTGLAIYLSTFEHLAVWLAGQLLLAFAMLHWFVLIHEAGHKTLFRSSALNKLSGHLSSLLAGIPFESWIAVHGIHHRWTGWQDLDATTATLVPRHLATWERLAINTCWRLWIPLFSILYRLQNYWNLPRLYRLFPRQPKRWQITRNLVILLLTYVTILYFVGIFNVLLVFGLSGIMTLMMQDILILSQHSHIPMELSHGEEVEPFAPAEQEFFTRSLKFPKWFSQLVLLNLDSHELHHVYPSVPGYYLNRIDYRPHNEVVWWRWIWDAKRVPGVVLLFQNSNDTGLNI